MTTDTCIPNNNISFYDCTLATCCRSQSFLDYEPNLPVTIVYLAIFAFFLVFQIGFGLFYRTWSFCLGMSAGLILEVVGYGGRIMIRSNPFNLSIFLTYFIPLGLGPACMTASIYLTLGRLVIVYGEHFSRLRPRTYTLAFVSCDVFSLCIQAVGGAFSSVATTDSFRQKGVDILIAGLTLQALSLFVFLAMSVEFALRVRKGDKETRNPVFKEFREMRRFKLFLFAIALAAAAIFIRCVYRIIELAQGFGGPIANDEISFLILEGPMIMIATFALSALHPGWVFGRTLWDASRWHLRSKHETEGNGEGQAWEGKDIDEFLEKKKGGDF